MKKRIAILFVVSLFSLAVCNTLNIFVQADALPAVIEQNYNKMNSISDYKGEFVVDYVSESWDYATVEKVLNEITSLSDEICNGYSSDYDKIYAMAKYVSENTAYDFDAAHNAVTFDVISLENVLEKKRTTCAGFSNLFSCLCNAQGYYCVNIRGSALSSDDGVYMESLDDENTVMNHEWTAVYCDERWIYVDCTWNSSNTYQNGTFYYGNGADDKYFDISVEELSVDHKAIIVDHRNFFDALSVLTPPEETESEQHIEKYNFDEQADIITDNDKQAESQETEITETSSETEITELSTNSETTVESSESETSEQTTEETTEESSDIITETEKESETGGMSMLIVIIGIIIFVAIAVVGIIGISKK